MPRRRMYKYAISSVLKYLSCRWVTITFSPPEGNLTRTKRNFKLPVAAFFGRRPGVSESGKSSVVSDTLVPKRKKVLKSRFVEYAVGISAGPAHLPALCSVPFPNDILTNQNRKGTSRFHPGLCLSQKEMMVKFYAKMILFQVKNVSCRSPYPI